jgi:hypothetical protein
MCAKRSGVTLGAKELRNSLRVVATEICKLASSVPGESSLSINQKITNFMEEIPNEESTTLSASQEITWLVWNQKLDRRLLPARVEETKKWQLLCLVYDGVQRNTYVSFRTDERTSENV